MNPYPGDRSVLILDNCAIHKSRFLREAIEDQGDRDAILGILFDTLTGCRLLFLPPYSPDLNPIEESFSCRRRFVI
jgi:transposase